MVRVTVLFVLLSLLFAVFHPIPTTAGPTEDLNEAIAALKASNPEKAKPVLLRILEAQGTTDVQRAYAYFLLAECFRGTPEALRYSAKAVELNPKSAEFHIQLGAICYADKAYPAALNSATKALELAPASRKALEIRGLAYRDSGETEKAIADFSSAIALDEKIPSNYIRRGIAYYRRNEKEKATADFQTALKLNVAGTHAGECYYYMGKMRQFEGKFDEAKKLYASARTLLKDEARIKELILLLEQITANDAWR